MSKPWTDAIPPHTRLPPPPRMDDAMDKSPATSTTASESDYEYNHHQEVPTSPTRSSSKDHRSSRYLRKRHGSATSPTVENQRTARSVVRTRSSSGVTASPRIGLRGRHAAGPAAAIAPQRRRSSSPTNDGADKHHRHSGRRGSAKDNNSKPSRTDSSSSRMTGSSRSCSRDRKQQVRRRSSSNKQASTSSRASSTRSRTQPGSGSTPRQETAGERGVTRGRSFQQSQTPSRAAARTKPSDSPPSVRIRHSQSMGRSVNGERSSRAGERQTGRRKPRSHSTSHRNRTRRSQDAATLQYCCKTAIRSKSSEMQPSTETGEPDISGALEEVNMTATSSNKAKELFEHSSVARPLDDQPNSQPGADDTDTMTASLSMSTPNIGFRFVAGKEDDKKVDNKPKQGKETLGSHVEQAQFYQSSPAFDALETDFLFVRNKGPSVGKMAPVPLAPVDSSGGWFDSDGLSRNGLVSLMNQLKNEL